ncbi:hypothetical protein H0H92_014843 [Tricholoma furcatifolium]|nr:hypothetical protein H0H92_014843 [Tricholoma furcatifolium]
MGLAPCTENGQDFPKPIHFGRDQGELKWFGMPQKLLPPVALANIATLLDYYFLHLWKPWGQKGLHECLTGDIDLSDPDQRKLWDKRARVNICQMRDFQMAGQTSDFLTEILLPFWLLSTLKGFGWSNMSKGGEGRVTSILSKIMARVLVKIYGIGKKLQIGNSDSVTQPI